jgi:hypothetical protein
MGRKVDSVEQQSQLDKDLASDEKCPHPCERDNYWFGKSTARIDSIYRHLFTIAVRKL